MVNIPIYCAKCEKWIQSGISAEVAHSIQINSRITYRCSDCGSDVPYIQGDYTITKGALEVVKSHDLTAKELKDLTRILQQAIERNTPAGQVREIIAREVPKAAGLNKFIVDHAGLYALLVLFFAFAQNITPFIIPFITPSSNNKTETEKTVKAKAELKTTPEPKKNAKIGVNDPCWCGSGKKKKKCHGSNSRPNPPSNLNKKPK